MSSPIFPCKIIKSSFPWPILIVLFFSVLYWLYMALVTDFIIVNDSLGYESLAQLLDQKGVIAYFQAGLDRELLYPFFVSLGMRIARFFGVSYHPVVTVMHAAVLFLTQCLMFILLRHLKVNKWISVLTLIYFALSPSVVNSGLLLYSEILTYPFAILIIYFMSICLKKIMGSAYVLNKENLIMLILTAGCLSLSFLAMTFVKAIFQLVASLCFTVFIYLLISSYLKRNRGVFIKTACVAVVFIFVYYGGTTAYKLTNKILNGNFAFTNRGPTILYGNAVRRTEKMDSNKVWASVDYAIGEDLCQARRGLELCQYWHFTTSDAMSYQGLKDFRAQNLSSHEIEKRFVRTSFERIVKHPFQYTFFSLIETIKMFFWELKITTYAVYPDGIDQIYAQRILIFWAMVGVPLVTLLGIVFLWMNAIKCEPLKLHGSHAADPESITLFCLLIFLMSFFIAHAPFFLVPRYAFTLIPLYLIVFAVMLQRFIRFVGQKFA
jgi:hypothetical protein